MIQPLIPDWPSPSRVHAMVTTREGGVSGGAYASLNLGLRCGDDEAAVIRNRNSLGALLPQPPLWLHQVHGTHVVDADRVRGADGDLVADGAYAREAGSVCAVLVADCMPVFLADAGGTAVCVVHAGWRGLCAGIIEAGVDAMGVFPGNMLAWLGPAIGQSAYEVGEDVRNAFLAVDARAGLAFAQSRPGHWWLDLYAIARQRLAVRGVNAIHGGGLCTYTDPQRFFSYRRERVTGRMAALIWLE